jgi:predicted dehydrogenase
MSAPLGLGIVGAGRFAAFVADAVTDLPDVEVRAVADPRTTAASALASAHDARAVPDWAGILDDDEVEAVVVATPPAAHADIAVAALDSGRHVFCEKPLAADEEGVRRVLDAVHRTGRVLVVDHVLRYNPILRALRRLDGRLLRPVQRFCFENDASDEDLDPGHWFWDPAASGGIFVEHGVHFFDAATMLVGQPATAVQALAARRAGGHVDLVSAGLRHGPDVIATHTHSFTHAHRCERQLMRLDFGTAEARVEGWIPVRALVDLWTDDAGVGVAERLPHEADDLMRVDGFRLPTTTAVHVEVERDAGDPSARGRGVALHVPHHVRLELTLGGATAKAVAYAESVRAAMADLAHAVRTGARPASGAQEGAAAVMEALAATHAAASGHLVTLPDAGTDHPFTLTTLSGQLAPATRK